MGYPRVSIIVLNWNGLKDAVECLESLKGITYPNYEVVVVDNASVGDDVARLRDKFGNYIHIIENDKNYGYTGGNNIGIRFCLTHSQPDYLLILNNDIVVAPDFLDHLVEAAKAHALVGVAGPKVYYHELPTRIQSAGATINMWRGQATSIGCKKLDTGQYDRQRDVDCVSGSCLLIKRDVVEKVGVFDESYFCYWDETDYCTRVREAGYRITYVPRARVWHKIRMMTLPHKNPIKQKIWQKTPTGRANDLPYYYIARNNFLFMKKHASRRQYSSFLIFFFGYYFWVTSATFLLYHRDTRRLAGFCRGVRDGLLSRNR
jgi:GT2 family glycosyltransferase